MTFPDGNLICLPGIAFIMRFSHPEYIKRKADIVPAPMSKSVLRGGCSSPFSQPPALSDFSGSGPSQSKHWNVRCPLPPGGSAKNKGAPHLAQVGRLACPMV